MYDLPLIIKFASVCLCVIKNQNFQRSKTGFILFVPGPIRPKFETLGTCACVHQSKPSHLAQQMTK